MKNIGPNLQSIHETLPDTVTLVAVSKTMPAALIQEAYRCGQRHFGENKVQELCDKQPVLPQDICWHLVGHLQTNKVKYIAPFVHLIHSVDSLKLLQEIDRQAAKAGRTIDCLLQMRIAQEESKFGMSRKELILLLNSETYQELKHVRVCGLMGMATNTGIMEQVRLEFRSLKELFEEIKNKYFAEGENFRHLSMGMSDDYEIAVEEGSTMVRVGSLIFNDTPRG